MGGGNGYGRSEWIWEEEVGSGMRERILEE